MTHLSICIVTWNTGIFLRECLASIEEHPPSKSFEVIVVDNASADGTAMMVKTEFQSVTLIVNQENYGYASANNQALAAATGEWLLLLNPDVRLLPGTFDHALAAASELPEFGALGIKQIGPDGKTQRSVRSFPAPMGVLWELLKLSKLFPNSKHLGAYRMSWFDYSGTIEVDQPMATFLLTTRAVYNCIGGMDEQFPIFFNDVDWCFRIKKMGRLVYYTDRSEIIHYGGAGTSKANRADMTRESKRSFLLFYSKHYRSTLPTFAYKTIQLLVRLSAGLQRQGSHE